jgi:hypothetical protein
MTPGHYAGTPVDKDVTKNGSFRWRDPVLAGRGNSLFLAGRPLRDLAQILSCNFLIALGADRSGTRKARAQTNLHCIASIFSTEPKVLSSYTIHSTQHMDYT